MDVSFTIPQQQQAPSSSSSSHPIISSRSSRSSGSHNINNNNRKKEKRLLLLQKLQLKRFIIISSALVAIAFYSATVSIWRINNINNYYYYNSHRNKNIETTTATMTEDTTSIISNGNNTRTSTVVTTVAANTTTSSNNSPPKSQSSPPGFVYHLHIPKTGGRTILNELNSWFHQSSSSRSRRRKLNCGVPMCCIRNKWVGYSERVKRMLLKGNKKRNTIFDGSHNQSSSWCMAMSYEITLPGILETKRVLLANNNRQRELQQQPITDDYDRWWYIVTTFRNPVGRFVSGIRHNMQKQRCGNYYINSSSTTTENNNSSNSSYNDMMAHPFRVKFGGYCKPHPYDHDQAGYFRTYDDDDVPFNPEHAINPKRLEYTTTATTTNSSYWSEVTDNVNFTGLTHYMDASMCLMAIDLYRYQYRTMTYEQMVHSCRKGTAFHIQSTKKSDPDVEGATTAQIIEVLQNWIPVDTQVYPRVLQKFRAKLVGAMEEYPTLLMTQPSYIGARDALVEEIRVWSQVALWIRTYYNSSTTTTAENNNKNTLFELMDGLSRDEKELIAPGMNWG